MTQSSIVELDSLGQSGKKFLIPLLCLWLYQVKLCSTKREKLSLVIFIEEAHHSLYRQEQRHKESVMNMLLRQCRELGIAIVVIDQHPHLISSAALGNSYTSICLNQKDPSDINRAAGLSLIDDSEKKWLSMLAVGQGIVKLQDRWKKPFLVQFPLVSIRKGIVIDELLERYLHGQLTHSGFRRAVGAESGPLERFRVGDTPLTNTELGFVEDVLAHPDDGVNERYKRLEHSGDKGNRLKGMLLEKGILEAETLSIGRTRKVLLRISEQAKTQLGFEAVHVNHGSLVHEYWKRFYAAKYRSLGYAIQTEASRHGGRVDVLARKRGESVAIEIETGKSNVVSNVRNCLRSKFNKVIIVATDEGAMQKIERALAASGLLIPVKVNIILRGQ